MISFFRVFGFPPPERRDSVRFFFAKGLPYTTRIYLAAGSLAAGLAIQIALLSVWIGLPFLLLGTGLLLVRGYDSRIRWKSFDLGSTWTTVTIEKIRQIEILRKKSRSWDRDALDISNALGCSVFFVLLVAAGVLSLILGLVTGQGAVGFILLIDSCLIFIPLWFSGMKFIVKHPNLNIKINLILKVFEKFEELKKPDEVFIPALMLASGRDGKAVPMDARFSIRFSRRPEGFYGLQAMINLNVVQGKSYPYFYTVLAARPGFGLKPYQMKILTGKDIICEFQEDGRAEVLVIRQRTTRTSGYHTSPRRCEEILGRSLEAGRMITGGIEGGGDSPS